MYRFQLSLCFVGVLWAIACTEKPNSTPVAGVRPQLSQVIFAGDLEIPARYNGVLKASDSIRNRRKKLRKPLMRVYEVLKGTDPLRPRTVTLSSIQAVFGHNPEKPLPALAEIPMLAGIQGGSVANSFTVNASRQELESTAKTLRDTRIDPLGLLDASGEYPAVKVYNLELARVAVTSAYLHHSPSPAPNGGAIYSATALDTLVAAARKSLASEPNKDVSLIMLGSSPQVSKEDRRKAAHALIDAGYDGVLSHHPGTFEGIETHGKGVIVHNPGPLFSPMMDKKKQLKSLVVKLHLDASGVQWIEIQPISVSRNKVRIGMGPENTYEVIDAVAGQSHSWGTTVINEFGRGIWQRDPQSP